MDYFPTILNMLDLPLEPEVHVDGVSFVPGLKGDACFNAERSFFWYSDEGRINSTGDRNAAVIRKGDFKLIEFFNENELELYDLSKDPGESHNLAEENPEVREALYKELLEWKQAMKVKDRKQNSVAKY
jgi:arylsulfatase A-like enzyme